MVCTEGFVVLCSVHVVLGMFDLGERKNLELFDGFKRLGRCRVQNKRWYSDDGAILGSHPRYIKEPTLRSRSTVRVVYCPSSMRRRRSGCSAAPLRFRVRRAGWVGVAVDVESRCFSVRSIRSGALEMDGGEGIVQSGPADQCTAASERC